MARWSHRAWCRGRALRLDGARDDRGARVAARARAAREVDRRARRPVRWAGDRRRRAGVVRARLRRGGGALRGALGPLRGLGEAPARAPRSRVAAVSRPGATRGSADLARQLGIESGDAARRSPRRRLVRVRVQHDSRGVRGGEGVAAGRVPNALVTMWTWITDDARDA